jgi:hypothetical protein
MVGRQLQAFMQAQKLRGEAQAEATTQGEPV